MGILINNPYLLGAGILGIAGFTMSLLALWQISSYRKRQKNLLEGEESGKLADIVARQKQVIASHANHLRELATFVEGLDKQTHLTIQKVSLIRYNPFPDTGGNMSFSAALLDAEKNGIVISSLHGRAGTRIYGKSVKKGESKHHLTAEELQAIKEAK